ncbi:MAG: DUF389 domain-containing protein [Cyanophyceae cyanobacterium]
MPSQRRPLVSDRTLQRITEQAELTSSYLVFMAMSGVLAAIAMLTNSVPILIGSMVVAPALPPLGLIAFALVARQPRLALQGLATSLLGLLVAMLFSVLTTWVLNTTNVIPPETNLIDKPLLAERVRPGWYSVAAALAAGIAGAIALAKQKTDTLVGVVAALALVPSVAAASIAFMSSSPLQGFGGLVLLGINVGMIVFSGVLTLLIVRPDWRK